MRKINFLSVLFSLFVISSCHYIAKKADCCKAGKSGKYHNKQSKCCSKSKKSKKKSCCGYHSIAGFAKVKDLAGKKVTGSVFFTADSEHKVKVTANIKGLVPNKKFAFHVHEFGTCENKGLLAGGHLNPWGGKHSGPKAKDRHLGDLGNIESDKTGSAVYTVSVKGRLKSFMGRSVIIHAQADDMKSQPTGNAGKRIACGVITVSMPPVQESPKTKPVVSTEKKAPTVKKAISTEQASVVKKAVSSGPAEKTQKTSVDTIKKTGN